MRIFCLLILSLISFSSYAQIQNPDFKNMLDSLYQHTVPLISVEEFKKLDQENLYILDTRESKEFNVSHLKQARHVGYFWFDMRRIFDIPKDATVVLYCSVGYRSEKIGEKLLSYGFKKVYNLYGSIFEWVNEGNPVYKSSGVQTSEIHTFNEDWSRWVTKGTKVY
ncbi:rhodanese-like domain-containing protein [Daejeonella oryzae]|uniref:rhodanese-like domain-containing protein n=1 Tax=Daejeonella oryzae TaxID=1122943 RepID=UPI0004277D12|nr:rhodanese-like domain-containing protein [Daejeonella oryzae]